MQSRKSTDFTHPMIKTSNCSLQLQQAGHFNLEKLNFGNLHSGHLNAEHLLNPQDGHFSLSQEKHSNFGNSQQLNFIIRISKH